MGWELETERLVARPWAHDPHHHAAAWRIYGDPQVTRHIGGHTVATEADAPAYVQFLIDRMAAHPPGMGGLAITVRDTGEIVGTALIKPLPDATMVPTTTIEIGWHLGRSAWGQGYATQMGRALLAYGFGTLDCDVLLAVVEPPNVASLRVTERLGMVREGVVNTWYGGIPLVQHRAVR